jgi:hypothetical protein
MRSWKFLLIFLASTLCFAAQPDRIAGTIDSSQMVALPGQIHHKALPQYDQGRVSASLQMSQITLLTLPTSSQQQALRLLVAEQQDPKSPNFHKWLAPEQYADQFGLSQNDVQKISTWLKSQGLSVDSVARGRNWIVFGGTAAQVETALRTEIHYYNVDGVTHFANATAPSIPAALSGIVTGFRGLDNFIPRPTNVKKAARGQIARPDYYDGSFNPPAQFVAPGDIEVIYDLTPLYNAGIDGTGQKMAIIGQTDVYLADLNDFRSGFGLPQISGCTTNASGIITSCTTSTTSNFQYVVVGTDLGTPSTCGDLVEADLDLEWSAATAPGAQVIYVNAPATFNSNCTVLTSANSVVTAYYHAIDNDLAPVISMSYGSPCEFDDNTLPADEIELTKGNAFGITFMNSSGDSGAASCDPGIDSSTNNLAIGGYAVSYPASSPEVTAVGGTAISYPTGFGSNFWSTPTTNPTNGGTAQNAPLPEIAWNDDVELADAFGGTALSIQESYQISASGGGVSNCSVQTADFSSCVSGFPQPSWQTVTIPGQASARFVPDVSLLASPNFPGYIFCTPLDQWINSTSTASSCASSSGGAAGITASLALTSGGQSAPTVIGGTSASSPVFAAIVTMLNQYLGANGLGNINPMLYTLAHTPSNAAFHQVTSGTNVIYCEGDTPAGFPTAYLCPGLAGSTDTIGFDASNADGTTGYNLVTGLGSIDANKLFSAWAAARTGSSVTISPSATDVDEGATVTFTAKVTPTTGVGTVSFSNSNNGGAATVLGTATLNMPYSQSNPNTGIATFATTALPAGSNSVTATFLGDASDNASTSAATTIIVVAPFNMIPSPSSVSVPAGQTATYTITITPVGDFTGPVNFTNSTNSPSFKAGSCTANLPAGALCMFNPMNITLDGIHSQNVTLTITTAANMALPAGAQAITVTGTSGSAAVTTILDLTVTATNQAFTLGDGNVATFPVSVGGTATVPITVANPSAGGGSPIPFVGASTTALPLTYTCTGVPSLPTSEIACNISPNNGQSTSATSVTVSLVTTPMTTQLTPLDRGSRIYYALLLPGLFGVVFLAGSRTRGVRLLTLIVVLACSTLLLGSCGGGGGGNPIQPNPGTPPGTYTVTISAQTAGPTVLAGSPVLTFQLNVQ